MPKSTATSWPSASTNRLPGMHVGVEEAVAQRVAQEGLDHARGRAPAGRSPWPRARRGRAAACRRSIPASARPRAVRSQSTAGTRKSGSSLVFSAISEARRPRAADPSRSRPSARSVSTTSIRRSRRASAESASACARREVEGVEIGAEAPLDAGPQHLHGDRLAALRRRDLGAMHLRDRGGGDRRAERREDLAAAACRARPRPPLRPRPAGTAPSCPAAISRSRASATPTTSGRVARNWPSFT